MASLKSRATTKLLMASTALLMAVPALAQTTTEPTGTAAGGSGAETTGLAEIIVTARRVAENLQDVPVAVSAFSGDQLLRQNATQFNDIQRFTPGLTLRESNSSPSASAITLRGQVQTDILATLDPSVGTYVDGAYWARAYGLNGDLLDIASVQVLKGPQGTLFGRNTTGGAILIDTADPDLNRASGKLSATYGRFSEFQATAVSNLPLGDKLAIRIAGQRNSRDGWVVNTRTGVKYNERDRWNFRGKVLFKPTDTFSLIGSAEYFKADEDSSYRQLALPLSAYTAGPGSPYNVSNTGSTFVGIITGNAPAAAGAAGFSTLTNVANAQNLTPNATTMNANPYTAVRTYTYGLTAALDTDFGAIKLITNFRRVKAGSTLDLDGTQYAIHTTSGFQNIKQFSSELQFTGKAFNDSFDFAAGGFVFHEKGFDRSESITVPQLNPNTSLFYGNINNDSIGVYGQGTYHFTDQFSFTGGLRYSIDDKGLDSRNGNLNRNTGTIVCSITGVTVLAATTPFPQQCAIGRRDSFDGISYTAGVEFKPNEDMLIYAKTAKGFRSGGQNLRAPFAAAFVPFKPEIAHSYELGLKSEFFDRRARVNLAAYYSTVTNIQRTSLVAVTVPGGAVSNATILGNAGKARFYGLEAEASAILFEGFTVSATGALTRPKYVRYADASGDRSFERFVNVPREQFSLAADYDKNFGSFRLRLRTDYSWTGKQALDPYFFAGNPQNPAIVAATTQPAGGLLGARAAVSFADDAYEVAVFGRNLTNNRDKVVALTVAPLGYVDYVRREPATYGITGTVRF